MGSRSFSRTVWCAGGLLAAALALSGCGPEGWAGGGLMRASATQPGDAQASAANPFGPPTRPADFDAARARLSLSQLPDDPDAPGRPTSRPAAVPDGARRRLEEARRLFAEQRYTETVIEAEKALRYEPNLAEGHRLIALASLLSGNESRARLSAERALTIDPGSLACHYVLARSAEKAGKAPDAMRAYRAALKCLASPDDGSYRSLTHYHLGRLLFANGYYKAAADQLDSFEETLAALGEKVANNPELATVARVHRAHTALTAAQARGYLGEYTAAAEALHRVAGRVPDRHELRAEYIRMLVRAGRHHDAAEQASSLLADSQGSPEAVQLLVGVHAAGGHPERAVAAIKSVVARQPENVELWLVYIDALDKAGKTSEAYHAARDLLARHPESPAARWKLIELNRSREDWPAWAAQLAEHLAARPEDAARVMAAVREIPASSVDTALEALAPGQAAVSRPAEELACARDVVAGALLERADKLEAARGRYDAALARAPDFLPGALAAGELYLGRCRWSDAIAVLEAAQKGRDRPSAQIEFLLARANDGLDRTAPAAEHYRNANKLDPADLRPLLAMARLEERGGNAKGAQQQYEAAIAADAGHMPAREGLIHLLLSQVSTRTGGRDQQLLVTRALSELGEMQKLAPQDPATLRSAALVQFLLSRDRAQYVETLRKLLAHHPDEQPTREDLFRALLEVRNYEQGFEVARQIVARDRCSAVGHEMLATAQLRLLQFDRAAAQYERMLEMYPNREEWIEQSARLLSLMQQYDRAIALYGRLLELDGIKGNDERERDARDKLVQVYRRAGQYDRALELIEKWLEDTTQEAYRQRYRGMLLQTDLAVKAFGRYVERCRKWLEADPDSAELHRWLLIGLLRADLQKEAIAHELAWLARKPDDEDRLDWFGDVLQACDHHAGAIDISKSLLAATEKPEYRRARFYKTALRFVAAKRYDQAIVALRQLIAQAESAGPEGSEYSLKKHLASVYVLADRPEEATRYLNKMLSDLNDELDAALAALEQQYQKVMDAADSDADKQTIAREMERARRLTQASANPRKSDILRQMYMAYHRQGQIEVAEQRLREALELTPDDAGICNDLGYSLADTGKNLEEAKRLTTLAVGAEPTNAAFLDSYAWVLYKLGQFEEARRWLEWGTALDNGDDPVIYDHLADAQYRSGRKDTAVTNWKRSLEIYQQEIKDGGSTAEKDLPDRVSRKLAAIEAGDPPPLASVGTRPSE